MDVAQGYAENYLFPKRIALPATRGNLKQLEERRHNIEKREAERIANAEATKAALEGKVVTVDAKIGEEGQLFGSVTSAQIADAIKDQLGIEIDRKRLTRGASIKTAGRHKVEVNLYRGVAISRAWWALLLSWGFLQNPQVRGGQETGGLQAAFKPEGPARPFGCGTFLYLDTLNASNTGIYLRLYKPKRILRGLSRQ